MEKSWLDVGWKILVLRGVVAIVFGLVAIVWPISTAVTLALVWGFWALADGIGSLVEAARPGPGAVRFLHGLMGVVALGAAFFAITSPGVTAVTLTWILGLWLLARGVSEGILAVLPSPPAPRGMLVLSAVVDLLLGVLFVANPGRSAVSLTVVLGVTAMAWGASFLLLGFSVRKTVQDLRGDESAQAAF